MAAYGNPGPSGGADLYSDAAPTSSPEAPPDKEQEKPDEGRTYTLPKEALAGKEFKPGEEIVFEIVRINDDSVEVKYASEKGKEESEAPAEAPAPAAGGGEMTSMME